MIRFHFIDSISSITFFVASISGVLGDLKTTIDSGRNALRKLNKLAAMAAAAATNDGTLPLSFWDTLSTRAEASMMVCEGNCSSRTSGTGGTEVRCG